MEGERAEPVNGRGIPVRNERRLQWSLVIICIIGGLVGYWAGTLLSRFYFQGGGHTLLLQLLLLCTGRRIPSLPLLLDPQMESSFYTAKYLPVCRMFSAMAATASLLCPSSIALLCATSLVCSAMWAFRLLQPGIAPSAFRLNSMIFLLFNALVSRIWSRSERPRGVSRCHFILGLACAIAGLLLPLADLAFREVAGEENFAIIFLSLSFALMVSVWVSITITGLLINGDFEHLIAEDGHFRPERLGYWITLVCYVVAWQTLFLAIVALVFLITSFYSSLIRTVTLPLVSILF